MTCEYCDFERITYEHRDANDFDESSRNSYTIAQNRNEFGIEKQAQTKPRELAQISVAIYGPRYEKRYIGTLRKRRIPKTKINVERSGRSSRVRWDAKRLVCELVRGERDVYVEQRVRRKSDRIGSYVVETFENGVETRRLRESCSPYASQSHSSQLFNCSRIPLLNTVATRNNNATLFRTKNSIKSDGVLVFDDRISDAIYRECCERIIHNRYDVEAHAHSTHNDRLFAYVFVMMRASGKRLSDIAGLTIVQLRQLRDVGACALIIPKTRKLGRLELRNVGSSDASPDICAKKTNTISMNAIVFRLVEWVNRGLLTIPFDVTSRRRTLDSQLRNAYFRVTNGSRKPKDLSFHALQRMYAGNMFLSERNINELRERMDHANRDQTNAYVNTYLAATAKLL